MTEKKSFPIRFGRGHSKVTLYDRTASLPYYRISYRLGAIRHLRTFKTLKDAKAHAQAISKKLCSQDVTVTQVTGSELIQLKVAQEILAPIKCRVDEAANQFAKASRLLGDASLEKAVRFYLSHNKTPAVNQSLSELVKHFLEAKKSDGISDAYYNDLYKRTRTLVKYTEVRVSDLTADLMAGYFKFLNFEAVNHNNQLRVIRVLLNFAQSQGYLPDTIDLLKAVSRKKASYPIYQPHEFEALLDGANDEMLPPLVLLGFCGVRPNEMRRLS